MAGFPFGITKTPMQWIKKIWNIIYILKYLKIKIQYLILPKRNSFPETSRSSTTSVIMSWSKQRLSNFANIGSHWTSKCDWLSRNSIIHIEIRLLKCVDVNFGSWSKWSKIWETMSMTFDCLTSFLNKELNNSFRIRNRRLKNEVSNTACRVIFVMNEASLDFSDFVTSFSIWNYKKDC